MSNPPACEAPPVTAARTKIRPIASVSPPGNLSKQGQPTTSPHPITSPTSSTGATSHKAKPAHPWMSIVHSGPWTQLPPAPSPFTPPRSGSLPATQKGWFKPRVTPPNPFEEAGEDTSRKARQKASKKPANQTEPSEPMSQSKNDSSAPTEKSDVRGKPSSRDNANAASVLGANSEASSSDEPAPSETHPCEDPPPPSAQTDGSATSSPGAGESSQDGPVEPPATAAGLPEGLGDTPNNLAKQGGLASESGVTDVAPTSMDPSNIPGLGSLTGDGPLSGLVEVIKRTEELGEVNKRLEELELGSTQLEKNLRDCNNEEEEEAMLTDWMALIQEKHMLARRDAEITHLTKQKVLEERQADLEYKLRCLLIKPKSEWSPEDRSQEQQMMDELLSVVEQRNQIVSSLDEDRQREKEEDSVLEAMQEKEIQKKGLKELKKSRGKFKALEVFRMLSGKAAQESTPESKDEEN